MAKFIAFFIILETLGFSAVGLAHCAGPLGPQKIAVIVGDYPGSLSPVPNFDYLTELFLGAPGSVSISDFIALVSQKRTTLAQFKIFGPYHRSEKLTYDSQSSKSVSYVMDAWKQELMAQAENDTQIEDFDRIVFFTPPPIDIRTGQEYALGVGSGSNFCDLLFKSKNGDHNFEQAWIKSDKKYTGIVYADLSPYWNKLSDQQKTKLLTERKLLDLQPIMHELGHTFGLGHANRIPRPSQNHFPITYDEVLPDSNVSLNEVNYGDFFSVMSSSAMGWPSVPHLAQLGWLEKRAIKEVKKSGVYRIFPNESFQSNLKGLKINRKGQAYLWVEYRKLNSIYEQNSALLSLMKTDGPLVYYTNPDQPVPPGWNFPNQTLILNFEGPGTIEPAFPTDYTLKTEWKDPYSNVELGLVSSTPDYLDVRVTFKK